MQCTLLSPTIAQSIFEENSLLSFPSFKFYPTSVIVLYKLCESFIYQLLKVSAWIRESSKKTKEAALRKVQAIQRDTKRVWRMAKIFAKQVRILLFYTCCFAVFIYFYYVTIKIKIWVCGFIYWRDLHVKINIQELIIR